MIDHITHDQFVAYSMRAYESALVGLTPGQKVIAAFKFEPDMASTVREVTALHIPGMDGPKIAALMEANQASYEAMCVRAVAENGDRPTHVQFCTAVVNWIIDTVNNATPAV